MHTLMAADGQDGNGLQLEKKKIGSLFVKFSLKYSKYQKKNRIFLSVHVFSTKVLIANTIFTSPSGDGTAISRWSSEPRECPAVCSAKAVLSSRQLF